MLQQENPLGSSLTIVPSTSSSSIKKPAPAKATNEPMIRSYTPPTLVMPKPRRVLTPTRAILAGYDNDKTQVEDEEEEQETGSMVQDYISPILLPTSHHGGRFYSTFDSFFCEKKKLTFVVQNRFISI